MSLKIVVIGAGLGGLAAAVSIKQENPAHDVLVVESAGVLAEIGAGLQLTPNATRLLLRWGLKSTLQKLATSPDEFVIRRFDGTKLLGERQNFADEMLEKYGSYYWDMHRADLQLALFDRAKSLGVRFQFGTQVTDLRPSVPELTTSKGEIINGDLIVAADDLPFWESLPPPIPTGDLAYRIVLQTKDLQDPELIEFMKKPRVCLWVGPDCHAIYYPLRNNTMANIVLLVPDNLPDNVAKVVGSLSEMKGIFEEWDPLFLNQVNTVDKWKLMHLDELAEWYNKEATVVFLGDACHPMLPYMAQGAGSALEDGAALGILLARCFSRKDLPGILKTYQNLRVPRSTSLQKGSMKQRHTNHLPDGPEQQERDKLAESQIYNQKPGYPFYWIDPAVQGATYGYDVVAELKAIGIESSSTQSLL